MKFLVTSVILSVVASCLSQEVQVNVLEAKAVLNAPPITGTLTFTQMNTTHVSITGQLNGLPAGLYGFHVHEAGDLSGGCTTALAHFDLAYNNTHGAPTAAIRHLGDLGNIEFGANNISMVNIVDSQISLNGAHSIIGRAIMLHEGEDDLGLTNHTDSLTTGNAGGRAACAVVGVSREEITSVSASSTMLPSVLMSSFLILSSLLK